MVFKGNVKGMLKMGSVSVLKYPGGSKKKRDQEWI
jgi:hypothetical protein